MNFGHFDGPVIVSQFSNFQSPPPGWGLKRDFKDAFDNVSRLHISITIFFTRSLSLMRAPDVLGEEKGTSPPVPACQALGDRSGEVNSSAPGPRTLL